MPTISSNHFSLDDQAMDALDYLRLEHPAAYAKVKTMFPEDIVMSGSWFDTDAMGVNEEWGSWLVDAIEATGHVRWEDGEPWCAPFEDDDDV